MAKTKTRTSKKNTPQQHPPTLSHEQRVSAFATSPDGFVLNAVPDIPDIRDCPYEPALIQLKPTVDPPDDLDILDQGKEGACTGFGLAGVINALNKRRGNPINVSPRMLYEMARRFDEWPGEHYAGSSCRGAIRGWHNMGVCREELWPYRAGDTSTLTIKQAKDARNQTIGAYYRLRPDIVDFHAALNEVGVLFVSAKVHSGWWKSATPHGEIPFRTDITGGHAFAIVGYNHKGFWVQNSWGPFWGRNGIALWSYEDWRANVKDAWVVRLALPTPQIFHLPPGKYTPPSVEEQETFETRPARAEIAGHFVHLDDGAFHDNGQYWSNLADVTATAEWVAKSDKYDHLLFYAHGGLNSISDSATRISAMKEVFKANRIYPFHFMYDTGLMEEIKDVVFGKKSQTHDRVAGIADWSDKFLEYVTRRPGRAIWREMKSDAHLPFVGNRAGAQLIKAFLGKLKKPDARPKKIHLVGHSTGGILLAHFLEAFRKLGPQHPIASCRLLAPACRLDLFHSHYMPHLGAPQGKFGIQQMVVYNLTDEVERDDHVARIYRKSLLYLVCHAFEEVQGEPLLGMQKFSRETEHTKPGVLEFVYSNGLNGGALRTASASHGGFDNDPHTMNDVLRGILGKKPGRPFEEEDLKY